MGDISKPFHDKFHEKLFLKSALTVDNTINSANYVLEWVEAQRKKIKFNIELINFSELKSWSFQKETGNICHDSGKFFSIEGINVKTNWGFVPEWEQPIINQPEIGILGIITKRINGTLYFLLQAKIEPGNINVVQLSPTLQATKSNYTQMHKGAVPLYLEYFLSNNKKVLLDQLQSEQGSRFLKKRNRNIIIEVNDDLPVYDNFCWLTLGQIKKLLEHDNVVNMDTRAVISTISYGDFSSEVIDFYNDLISLGGEQNEFRKELLRSAIENETYLHSITDIISWVTSIKSFYEINVERMPLNKIKDWYLHDERIARKDNKYFSVVAVRAEIENRENKSWTQPMIQSSQEGIIAFLVKKINGIYHFLVQAKLEAGNLDIIELAPTVQCVNDDYSKSLEEQKTYFLNYVLLADKKNIKYDTFQSEEGGRFYMEQNRNMIIEVEDDFSSEVPANYKWMTLNQIKTFIKFNNYFNIQARNLISIISFV